MNYVDYGNSLIESGKLTWRRNTRQYQDLLNLNYYMNWPTSSYIFGSETSGEEIILVSAKKHLFSSVLHFAWKVVFYDREIDNKVDMREVFKDTELREIIHSESLKKIRQVSASWFSDYSQLLQGTERAYSIWNENLDILLVFESGGSYILWGWSTTA